MELVKKVYELTSKFPPSETCGIISQIRRASVSIPSNIAEGYQRGSRKEYLNFIRISFGSGAELETQLELAKELSLAPSKDFEVPEQLLNEAMRMLNGLIHSLASRP